MSVPLTAPCLQCSSDAQLVDVSPAGVAAYRCPKDHLSMVSPSTDRQATANERFWLEHELRCVDCGRLKPLAEARGDGWKRLDGAPLPSQPSTLKGRCWRCDREQRAAHAASA